MNVSVVIEGSKAEKASEEGKSHKRACTAELLSPVLLSGLPWSDMLPNVNYPRLNVKECNRECASTSDWDKERHEPHCD